MSIIPFNSDTQARVNKAYIQLSKDLTSKDLGSVFADCIDNYNNQKLTLQGFAGATRSIMDAISALDNSSYDTINKIVYSIVKDVQITDAISDFLEVLETELRLTNELGTINTIEYENIHFIMATKLASVIGLAENAKIADLAHAIYDSLDTATINRKLTYSAIEADIANTVIEKNIRVDNLASNINNMLSSSYPNSISIFSSIYFNNKYDNVTTGLIGSSENEIALLNDLNTILYNNRIGNFADFSEDNYLAIAANINSSLGAITIASSSYDLAIAIINPIGLSDSEVPVSYLWGIAENSVITPAKIAMEIANYINIILGDYSPNSVAGVIDGYFLTHTLGSTTLSADISSSVVDEFVMAQRIIANVNEHIFGSSYTGTNRDLAFDILIGISPVSSTNSNDLSEIINSSALPLFEIANSLIINLEAISHASTDLNLRDVITSTIGSSYFDSIILNSMIADIDAAQLGSADIATNIYTNLAAATTVENIVDAIFSASAVSVFNPDDPALLFNDITNTLLSVAQIAANIQSSIVDEQTATGIANAIFGVGRISDVDGLVGVPYFFPETIKDRLLNDILATATIAGIIGDDNLYQSLDINGNVLDNTLTAVTKANNEIAVSLQTQLGNATELSNAVYLNIANNIYGAIANTSTSIELASAIINNIGLESSSQIETIDALELVIDHTLSVYPIAQNLIASIVAIENFSRQDSGTAAQSLADAILFGMQFSSSLTSSSLAEDISNSAQSLEDVAQRIISNLEDLSVFTPSSFADAIGSSITIAGLLLLENAQFDSSTIIEDLNGYNSSIIAEIGSSIVSSLNSLPTNPSIYNIRDAIFSSSAISSSHNNADELKLIADLNAVTSNVQDIAASIVLGLKNIDYASTATDIANVLFGSNLNQITVFGLDNEKFLDDISLTIQTINGIALKMQDLLRGITVNHNLPLTPANLVSNAILNGATIAGVDSSDIENLIADITFAGTVTGIIGQTDITDIVDIEGNLVPNTITAKLKAIDGKTGGGINVDFSGVTPLGNAAPETLTAALDLLSSTINELDSEIGDNFVRNKNSIIQVNINNALRSLIEADALNSVNSSAAAPITADNVAAAIINSVAALALGSVEPNLLAYELSADITSTALTYSIAPSAIAANLQTSILGLGFGDISASDLESAIFTVVSSYSPGDNSSFLADIKVVETLSGSEASIDNSIGLPFSGAILSQKFYSCTSSGPVGGRNDATLVHTAVDTTNGWLDTMKACMQWTKSGLVLNMDTYTVNTPAQISGSYDGSTCYNVDVANAFSFCMGSYYSEVDFYIQLAG